MIKKRKILLEELSVSDSVKQITNEIYTQLLQKLKSIPSKISDRNNCVIKKGSFQYYTIKGKKDSIPDFKVNFVVYYLEDEQEYSYLIKHKIINSGGYTEAEKKCIGVFLSMIGNEPSNDFKSTIMHEVNHIYQISNGQTKNKSLYDEVVKRVNSSNEEDRNIAMLLYFSFPTEQDSFISQYYTYLDANDISSKKAENFIEDDECPYCQFLDYYDYFDNHIDMQFRIKSKTRFVKGLDVNKYSEDLSKILKNNNIEINNNFNITNNTPFDLDRQNDNLTQLMSRELRRFGKITTK